MLWIVVPSLVAQGGVTIRIMNYILLAFLFQYIPKLLHLVLVGRRLQRVTGYIFGTAYSGFVLNLAAYFSAAHVSKSKALTLSLSADSFLLCLQIIHIYRHFSSGQGLCKNREELVFIFYCNPDSCDHGALR